MLLQVTNAAVARVEPCRVTHVGLTPHVLLKDFPFTLCMFNVSRQYIYFRHGSRLVVYIFLMVSVSLAGKRVFDLVGLFVGEPY